MKLGSNKNIQFGSVMTEVQVRRYFRSLCKQLRVPLPHELVVDTTHDGQSVDGQLLVMNYEHLAEKDPDGWALVIGSHTMVFPSVACRRGEEQHRVTIFRMGMNPICVRHEFIHYVRHYRMAKLPAWLRNSWVARYHRSDHREEQMARVYTDLPIRLLQQWYRYAWMWELLR